MSATQSIAFAQPWISEKERDAVLEVLRGPILAHGPQNKAFEQEFGHFLGEQAHCATLSSCMAALHLAYWQLGIGPGDEVLVPAQTHVATAHAVEVVRAKPVFVDCQPETGNMNPAHLEALITPRTRAIGLVHFVGIPCEMDAIMDVARRHDLLVIEDCALAVGTRYRGTHVGLIGDVGCFSFYPVKHMTTGEGGMFVSRDKELVEKVSKARGFGVDRTFQERSIPGFYDVPSLGLHYRMSDINAALGRVQLSRIEGNLERRRINFQRLQGALASLSGVRVLDSQAADAENSHYCLSAVLLGPLVEKRQDVIAGLKEAGIGSSIYYPQPVPMMTYYREKYGCESGTYSEATAISDSSIALPVGPHLTDEDVQYIAKTFEKILHRLT